MPQGLTREARFRGSLLGLAVGDALGAPVEFCAPGTFAVVKDLRGGGPFGLAAGYWTDDTSMALCLAESLVECRGFNAFDQMKRYCRWYREGQLSSTGHCFDIGNTTAAALRCWEMSGDPFAGSTDPNTAGNGSLMRLAPVALFYSADLSLAIRMAADSSRTTHGARTAVDSCRYYAALIVGAVQGIPRSELLSEAYARNVQSLCPEVLNIAHGSFRLKQPPAIRGTGYVIDCLEAALWAFCHARDFADGALAAVNLGNDADTTGAVYGQLAGAYFGIDGIPPTWLEQLAHRSLLERFAQRLFIESSSSVQG